MSSRTVSTTSPCRASAVLSVSCFIHLPRPTDPVAIRKLSWSWIDACAQIYFGFLSFTFSFSFCLFPFFCFSFFPGTNTTLLVPNLIGSKIQLQGTLYTCCKKGQFKHQRTDRDSCLVSWTTQIRHIFPEMNRQWGWIMLLMSDLRSGCLNWKPYKFWSTLCIAKGSRQFVIGSD